jgi:hypothetical protein
MKCPECLGEGKFWTEWSDKAETSKAELGIKVLYYPDPEDGTVLIECTNCKGEGSI